MQKQLKIKKMNNQGAAMMVVVVIIGILMIFCFSLLLASYTLYASQNKNAASKRNSEAANTLSRALETELTRGDSTEKDSALWKYLRCNLNQNEWKSGEIKYFDMHYNQSSTYFDAENPTLEGYPGKIQLAMYWKPPKGQENEQFCSNPNGIRLTIEITCDTASQTYTISNQYLLSAVPYDTNDYDDRNLQYRLQQVINNPNYNVYNHNEAQIDTDTKWIWLPVGRD